MIERDSNVTVFAYGSNMCVPRMRSRAASAEVITTGYVEQRLFVFHKRSIDGSAKADAAVSDVSTERVWGVVYRVHKDDKRTLDECEFLGTGYDEEEVEVVLKDGSMRAWMYVARREAIDPLLLPYTWYHDYIIHGALDHGLPESYVEHLMRYDSRLDPDAARHATNRRVIET